MTKAIYILYYSNHTRATRDVMSFIFIFLLIMSRPEIESGSPASQASALAKS
jgi:hypothetical protein